jgi:hypothetical protein
MVQEGGMVLRNENGAPNGDGERRGPANRLVQVPGVQFPGDLSILVL